METNFEQLASKYDLPVPFVKGIYELVEDKENFPRAVKMFADGLLPYEAATGKDPINVAELRRTIARNLQAKREKARAAMERHRQIVDYYNSCISLTFPKNRNSAVLDEVFIKDGRLVAFAHYEPKQGGIYAANNEVMPNFQWEPHKCLARLRKLNKAFYRQVKKAAFNSPREWFDFNLK